MAGHKNNGRTDKSHAKSPYIHITEVSVNPHVFAHAYRCTQNTLWRYNIKVTDVFRTDSYQRKNSSCSPVKCEQFKLASPIRSRNIQKPETCGFVPGRNLDLFRRSVCIFHSARSVFPVAACRPRRSGPDLKSLHFAILFPLLVFISAIIIILVVVDLYWSLIWMLLIEILINVGWFLGFGAFKRSWLGKYWKGVQISRNVIETNSPVPGNACCGNVI